MGGIGDNYLGNRPEEDHTIYTEDDHTTEQSDTIPSLPTTPTNEPAIGIQDPINTKTTPEWATQASVRAPSTRAGRCDFLFESKTDDMS